MRPKPALVALVVASAVWLPLLHILFSVTASPDAVATSLARRQSALWSGRREGERGHLARSNPEWELMRRTFNVLAFANLALTHPEHRAEYLATIDRILASTLSLVEEHGQQHFLLPYAAAQDFRDPSRRSLFVDGEIALMLAVRQTLEPHPRWTAPLEARTRRIASQLERAPVLAAESYPDEGWTFCNVVALVALRLHDGVAGTDHRPLVRRWIASARAHLVDPSTGLLVSSFDWQGRPKDGPEGSSLWLVAPMLLVLDPPLARDQYERARRELARDALGFAWAREWPGSWPGGDDIDSGPTVPLVGANAGSSGLALVAAHAFGDAAFERGLLASLELGGFPVREGGELRYAAGNDLADAVLLYALVQGPLWERARALGVTP